MSLRENIKWMVSATKGMRIRIVLFIVLGLLAIAASLLSVWLTKLLVDAATRGAEDQTIGLLIAF